MTKPLDLPNQKHIMARNPPPQNPDLLRKKFLKTDLGSPKLMLDTRATYTSKASDHEFML